jgi:hypothetical protein
MNTHPILFSAPMVRAILEGRKTQTRRVIPSKLQLCRSPEDEPEWFIQNSKYGQPGDHLWVRETWAVSGNWDGVKISDLPHHGIDIVYRASEKYPNGGYYKWKPSIFMPRWASRITLKVMDVRVERVQDISETDAKAEGVDENSLDVWMSGDDTPVGMFGALWDSINEKRGFGWDVNPWVWVVTFSATP